MKAWEVRNPNEWTAAIVFAETPGKARVLAMHTEACEGMNFCDIEVHREKAVDEYYTPGKREMDWRDPADRLVMVRDLGFACYPYESPYPDECLQCPAKEYCDSYNREDW